VGDAKALPIGYFAKTSAPGHGHKACSKKELQSKCIDNAAGAALTWLNGAPTTMADHSSAAILPLLPPTAITWSSSSSSNYQIKP
jgi:hypothetical protein